MRKNLDYWKRAAKDFKSNVKFFIQRANRGYDDQTFWWADVYLAGVFAGVLDDLANKSVGVPCHERYVIDNDKKGMWEKDYDFDLYKADLERMRDFFIAYADDDAEFSVERQKWLNDEQRWTFNWMAENFSALWD